MWNMEEKKIQGFEQAVRVLPLRLRQEAMALPADQRARVEELRLRWGRPMAAVLPELLSGLALCCIGGMGLACAGKEKAGNN